MNDQLSAALARVTRIGERPSPEEERVIAQAKAAYARGIYWTLDPLTGETHPSPAAQREMDRVVCQQTAPTP